MRFCYRLLLILMVALPLVGCGAMPTAPLAIAQEPAPATTAPDPPPSAFRLPPSVSLLRVHFIDVGQGDSILIQAPDGATMLIDGGYSGSGALAYLTAQKITKIDVMIATHPHADHIGGLVDVLRALPVGEIWTSGAVHTTGVFEQLLDAIADAKVPYHEAKQGDTIALGNVQFAVLHSDLDAAELNDSSVVLHLVYKNISFLFTGDAERSSEQAMLRDVKSQLPSTILKVGHHGSYTSSSPEFLAVVRPAVAVYSAGAHNSYGHPHASTIHNLEQIGARIYGTGTDGTVVVTTDGRTYAVTTRTGAAASGTAPPAPAIPSPSPPPSAFSAPPSDLRYDPAGADRDCGDFATSEEAYAFFIAAGGPAHDPHRLDGDSDGQPCESLPHARPTPNPQSPSASMRYDPLGPDRDCGDFATHEEAQAFFVAAGGPGRDRHRLDGDSDGEACESLPHQR